MPPADLVLSFKKDLWDSIEACLNRITRGKHDLQTMATHFLDRARLEDQYAKLLMTSCKLPPFELDGTVAACWTNITSSGSSMAGQHAQFAIMFNEVAAELEKMVVFLRTTRDTAKDKHLRVLRNKEIAQKYHLRQKSFYHDCISKAEKAIAELETAKANTAMSKKVQALTKAASGATTQVDKANIEYRRSVELLKAAEEEFDAVESALLEELEEAEAKRLELCRKLFERFAQSHEFLKHALDQILAVSQQTLTAADSNGDRRLFIFSTCTHAPGPVPHVVYEYKPSAVIDKHRGFSGDVATASEPESGPDEKSSSLGSSSAAESPKRADSPKRGLRNTRSLRDLGFGIKPPLLPVSSQASLLATATPPSPTTLAISVTPDAKEKSAPTPTSHEHKLPPPPPPTTSGTGAKSPTGAATESRKPSLTSILGFGSSDARKTSTTSQPSGTESRKPSTTGAQPSGTDSRKPSTSGTDSRKSSTERRKPSGEGFPVIPTTSTARRVSTSAARNSVKAVTGGNKLRQNSTPYVPIWATATHNYSSSEPTDLNFVAGQRILLLHSPANEDWWTGDVDGRSGTFPKNRVKVDQEAAASLNGGEGDNGLRGMNAACVALHEFVGQEEDELSFKVNEELVITGIIDGWYLGRKKDGDRTGIFPCVYVKLNTATL